MSDHPSLNHRYLFSKFSKYARSGFTGRLNIKIEHNPSWRIYFSNGSIIWATGGIHPVRRWLRHLKGCNSQLTVPQGMTEQELLSVPYECWDYLALALMMQESHINSEQVKYIVEGSISEVLFDIVQALSKVSSENMAQIKMLRKPEIHPCNREIVLPPWMWRTESAKQRVLSTWETWVNSHLSTFSPDAGLKANQDELEAQELHSLTQYFRNIEKQEKTLRDLALENQTSVISILQTMKTYSDQGLIQFRSLPDLWKATVDQPQHHVGSYIGQNTVLSPYRTYIEEENDYTEDDYTPIEASPRPSLRTPMSGWLQPSKQKTALKPQEGVKVNVMEILVAQELERQLKAIPQATAAYITKLDVITYALNRLPPLYAASLEGVAYQKEEGKENHKRAIQLAVQRAISAVQRDPLRRATRIQSVDDLSE